MNAGAFVWRELDVYGVANPSGNTDTNWIDTSPGAAATPGFTQDADGDGITNGVKNVFGSNPATFSTGLIAGTKSGNTFTHPQNATPANAMYRQPTAGRRFWRHSAPQVPRILTAPPLPLWPRPTPPCPESPLSLPPSPEQPQPACS